MEAVQCKDLPIDPKHVLLLSSDRLFSSFSPAPSSSAESTDRGYESERQQTFSPQEACPMSPSSSFLSSSSSFSPFSPRVCDPFSAQYLLISSEPGFSFGIMPCGVSSPKPPEFERLSIPLLQDILDASQTSHEPSSQSLELTSVFTMADVSCLFLTGENQLWVGTEKGTLHSLELYRESTGFKLKNHTCVGLNVPVLALAVRASTSTSVSPSSPTATLREGGGTRGEVVVGTPYGYAVVFEGLVGREGHFKEHFDKMTRRITRFTNSPTDCAVKRIAYVPLDGNDGLYWCSYGGNVAIIRASDWCKLGSHDAREGLHLTGSRGKCEVNQLLVTNLGVWISVYHCTTIVLRDKMDFGPKLQLTYCDPQHSRQQRSQITTLHLSNSFLFIGTKKGDVMVFRIQATPLINDSAPSYTFVASTHIAARPVLNIFTTDEATPIDITTPPISDSFGERLNSRFQDTPLFHTSLNILIVTGPDREKPTGQMHLYELSLTPPTSLRSSCTVSPMSYVSQKSLNSRMTPQKLTVVSSRNDFTPLREKS